MEQKRMIKGLSVLSAIVMFVGILSACNGVTKDKSSTASFDPGKSSEEYSGKLEIWSWSESEVEILAKNFNAVYPDVEVVYVPVDNGDVNVKLQAAVASNGDFPDIAYQEMTSRGKIFDMDIWDDLAAEPYNMDKNLVWEPLLGQMETEDGRILGVDREFNPSGFVFRRSLAEQYLGTSDPDAVYGMISDWDKFVEVGKTVREASGNTVYMIAGLDDVNWMINGQYTKEVFVGDTAHLTDYFTHMFTPMAKIRDAGIAGKMKRWTPAWNASYNDANVLVYEYAPWSGSAALKANAPDAEGDWTVINATGGAYVMGGTAYGIPKNAKHKENAWAFIQWTLLSEEGTQACVDDLGVVAPLKGFYEPITEVNDPYFNGQDVNKFLLEEVAPLLNIRPVHTFDSILNEVMGVVMEMMENDTSFLLEQAIDTAIGECTNRLPKDITID